MANFWLNLLSEMESLTTDDDHTVLLPTRVVDLDFDLVDPFYDRYWLAPDLSKASLLLTQLTPNKLVTEKSCYL